MGVVVFEIGELLASVLMSMGFVIFIGYVLRVFFGVLFNMESDRRVERIQKDRKDIDYSE